MTTFHITTADAVPLTAQWVHAPSVTCHGVVLLAPATGVRRHYYGHFAQHLASHGFDVLLWDPRGIGDSRRASARHDPATMRDWGERDLDAVIRHAREQRPRARLWLLGHSSGGHLAGLAPSLSLCDGLILVAAGTCDWRDYPASQWPRLWAVWWLAVPALTGLLGYLPGWAGVGHDLPRGVARQWRRWSLTKGYLFGDPAVDTSGFGRFDKPLLALSMADDLGFSPPKAVRQLLARFAQAPQTHVELRREGGGASIGHFGFFRPTHAHRWTEVTNWLLRMTGTT